MQCRRQHLRDHPWLLVHLPFGEAQNLEAAPPQVEIAGPVILEGHPAAVVEVAVGFDDHSSLRPEKVDEMRADPHVDPRARQVMTPADLQEVLLEVAAGWVRVGLAERQAEHASLAHHAAQLPSRERPSASVAEGETQVGDGPSRASHRNAPVDGHVAGCQRDRAVDSNTSSSCPSPGSVDDHVHGPVGVASQSQEGRRAAMTDGCRPAIEHPARGAARPAADGQRRRQESALRGEGGMADRVYPAMDAVQRATSDPRLDRVAAQTDRVQLRARDDTVLPFRDLDQGEVGMDEFSVHLTDKSSSSDALPPGALSPVRHVPLWETERMRVLIADDHGIVRSGIRLLLEQQGDIEVVGEAADGAEARELVIRERPDLAILDVKMPKLTGLQATREIKLQAPEVAVLILSMHDDERYLFEALKAGASGYVLKAQADTDLLAAIRAVERGEPFLTPEAQRTLIKDVLERGSSGEEELTPREEEVVKLVAEANTTKQIAEVLHLSEKTVENHRANAMRKLGMRDRVELVRYAIRRGLIEP